MIHQESPTVIRISGLTPQQELELQGNLTYIDKSIEFEISRLKNSQYGRNALPNEVYLERMKLLKEQRKKSLLFLDDKGFWTYSGLKGLVEDKLGQTATSAVVYPEFKTLPWSKVPDRKLRPYQEASIEKLLAIKHGAVEIGTGLGKSFIALHVCREIGGKSVVMAPSISIAKQLYSDFTAHFGKKYVGMFGDGKKDFKKQIVVCIGQSLANVEEGSEVWEHLSKALVFIGDESHLIPANTLLKVCFGLMAKAHYRFFFSGTQMRNDGLDLVLEAITGPIVYRMTVQEGVDNGYLAKPIFRIINCESKSSYNSKDVNRMTRKHLYYNEEVLKAAADVVNKSVSLLKRPTLILVEELEQFTKLLPYLKHPVKFAHGGVNKENKDRLPPAYHESDPDKLVEDFNAGKFMVLAGTSCISTGTDIRVVEQIVYLMGGKSEIKVKQAVGRATRLSGTKKDCFFTDFCVVNVESTLRHAMARKAIYEEIYPDVRVF